ncbi:MAG: ribonuclease R, partial [Lachnospiraceae bacterium]|nr:ribonuclease R [Candidatus Merdinaster equi]
MNKKRKENIITYTGRFSSTQKGFGFVQIDERDEELFIAAENVSNAMNGDLVEVRLVPVRRGKRPEGVITNVIERVITQVVGTFEKNKSYGFVLPDNKKITSDIFIPKEK